MKKLFVFLICLPSFCYAGSMNMIGQKGKTSEVDRVIQIKMHDNYYIPNKLTKKIHIKHQPEMELMMENEILLANKIDYKKMKEASKKNHSMSHSHANSVLLEPGKKGELIWKFNTDAKLEAACNVPGHYESGMIAKIN